MFVRDGNRSKALYAQVSQIPPNSGSASIRSTINALTLDLSKPEAKDPDTRLRILVILGMIGANYDAGFTRAFDLRLQVPWAYTPARNTRAALRIAGATASISLSLDRKSVV